MPRACWPLPPVGRPRRSVAPLFVVVGAAMLMAGATSLASAAAAVAAPVPSLGPSVSGTSSAGDRVWLDQNGDGVQDAAEKGLPGVTVTVTYLGPDGVTGGGDDVAFPTSTDSAGAYLVSALPAGSYLVTVDPSSLPPGVAASYDLDGVGTANVAGLTLAADENARGVDFGYRGSGGIGDRVWDDRDANGVLDAGEPGIAGVRLTTTWAGTDGVAGTADDVALAPATTAADGAYHVTGLPAGSYKVAVDAATVPAGYVSTYDLDRGDLRVTTVSLAAGQVRTGVDFGLREVADLAVTQTQVPRPMDLGGVLTMRITVTNQGPGVARQVSISDQVDYADYPNLHVAGSGWLCTQFDGPFFCQLDGELAAGHSASVDVTAPISDPLRQGATSTVTASSATPDPDEQNNAVATAVELTLPDLSLAVSLVGGPGPSGGTVEIDYVVKNAGPSFVPQEAVLLHEQLPEQMSLVSVTSDAWRCDPVYQGFLCAPLADLAEGSVTIVHAVAQAQPVAAEVGVVNRAWVTLTYRDPTPQDLESTIAFVLGHVPDATLTDVLPDTGAGVDEPVTTGAGALVVVGTGLLVVAARRRRH